MVEPEQQTIVFNPLVLREDDNERTPDFGISALLHGFRQF